MSSRVINNPPEVPIPKLTVEGKQMIQDRIAEALSHYYAWKTGGKVPDLCLPYLDILDTHVQAYRTGLGRMEEDAVDYFLHGWSIERIAESSTFTKAGISIYTIRRFVFGTRGYEGLVSTMIKVFMQQAADFCPFCHDKTATGKDKGFHPKLSGTVCPHKEMMEGEA